MDNHVILICFLLFCYYENVCSAKQNRCFLMTTCLHVPIAAVLVAKSFLDEVWTSCDIRTDIREQRTERGNKSLAQQRAKRVSYETEHHLSFGNISDLGRVMLTENKTSKEYCRVVSAPQSNPTNLSHHLKTHHKPQYDEWVLT